MRPSQTPQPMGHEARALPHERANLKDRVLDKRLGKDDAAASAPSYTSLPANCTRAMRKHASAEPCSGRSERRLVTFASRRAVNARRRHARQCCRHRQAASSSYTVPIWPSQAQLDGVAESHPDAMQALGVRRNAPAKVSSHSAREDGVSAGALQANGQAHALRRLLPPATGVAAGRSGS